ncbi:ABC-type transport system involved in multi-copper enzyme maturation permease subunit [Kibdelosporangium banguiense]|uniref:ABC-type transport system involved in multi-copper enzyme maturation permease subunit n=1 Tax=Kibdelosporangium banguiense TaxID=1365924 RepID=A0ABS4U1F0_9PSEU|nr:ABC transporter permease [Kibdelosporangium banguiense]MBP2330480.1 ABC-type transport system involved in multi-copper enzyme maturation permease subunit [Kibdelosporangium banguiense]
MIWVTWRQQRMSILTIAGLVLVLAGVLVYVRADVMSLLPNRAVVSDKYEIFLNAFTAVMIVVPPLAGVFTGGPLFAREIEQRTHIFGLTQAVSRRRWLVTKLVMAGGTLAVSMITLGMVAAWALGPLNFLTMSSRLSNPSFEIQGLTVAAYSLAAFTIGAVLGLLLRNTLAAMVVTIVAYAILLSVAIMVRPYYAEPTRVETPLTSAPDVDPFETWALGGGYLDANGKKADRELCLQAGKETLDCLREHGVVGVFTDVHLPGQFWRFQLTESALFLMLSAGLLGAGVPIARRRLS